MQGEYQKQLAELDASLASALPRDGVPFRTHDLVYKSSGTPVRYLFELPIPVDVPDAHVQYRFATDQFDIAFGVFFQGLDGKVSKQRQTHISGSQSLTGINRHTSQMETVLPSQRVDSHYEPVAGDVHIHRPGTVILVCTCGLGWGVLIRFTNATPPPPQLWDNSYSWLANKALSYSVHLRYPTGLSFEQERMQK